MERWTFKTVYTYLVFDLTCYEIWWGKLEKFEFLLYFLSFSIPMNANFNKNYRISANILKVCTLGKRLTYRFIKSVKNHCSYILKSLIVVLYICVLSCIIAWFSMKINFKLICNKWNNYYDILQKGILPESLAKINRSVLCLM